MQKYKFSNVEGYFSDKLKNLKIILTSGNKFEVTLLALCYIDALANLFEEGKGIRDKFINLIFSYGSVNEFRWDKVNLAEFKKSKIDILKSKICSSCYEIINLYVEQNRCQYDYSNSRVCIEKDKTLSEVIKDIIDVSKAKTCRCNIISNLLLRSLYDSTYGGILYRKYRCESVHEAKLSELWTSIREDEEPFYMDIQDSLPDFSIPYKFIMKTLEQCLINLKKYK